MNPELYDDYLRGMFYVIQFTEATVVESSWRTLRFHRQQVSAFMLKSART